MSETPGVLTPFELFEKYVFTPSKALGLSDTNLKLLVIHAYALKILTNLIELKIYLKAISDGLQSLGDRECLPALSADQKESFENLNKNCLKFPHSQFKLPEPGNLTPAYSRERNVFLEDAKFSDRNNIILLHMCNCLFYNDMTGKCSLEHLMPGNKKISTEFNRLFKFYKNHDFTPFEITQEMRQDWSKVVQGLTGVEKINSDNSISIYDIYYDDETGCHNALVPGIMNFLYVLAKICNAEKTLTEMIENVNMRLPNTKLRKFRNFLAKISRRRRIKLGFVKPVEINYYPRENPDHVYYTPYYGV